MAFDDNIFDFTETKSREFTQTTTTTNSANLNVGLENVGNETTSLNDVGNTDVTLEDSFHSGSYNQDWDVEDSNNTGSYNDTTNVTDSSTHDHSINAGVREYNTGFGDLALGGAAAGGDLWVNNQNTIVDQSVNGNILSGGGVFQIAKGESVVASGDGALAAGDDIDVEQTLIGGTNIDAGGDVLIEGSTKTVDVVIGSNNTSTVTVNETDTEIDVDLDNVGNQYSATLDITNSFTQESADVSVHDWDVDANVIWDSEAAVVADDVDIELDL
jgi:hypothetical protein